MGTTSTFPNSTLIPGEFEKFDPRIATLVPPRHAPIAGMISDTETAPTASWGLFPAPIPGDPGPSGCPEDAPEPPCWEGRGLGTDVAESVRSWVEWDTTLMGVDVATFRTS